MKAKALLLVSAWMLTGVLFPASVAFAQKVDPRGPVAGYAGRIQVTREGVAMTGGETTDSNRRAASREPPWNPKWITVSSTRQTRPFVLRLRKTVTLPAGQALQAAETLVSADCFYRLWINGVLVSRGPDDAGDDYSPHEPWTRSMCWQSCRRPESPFT